jgi:uncharacterized damage-inducible protein DinB
MKNDIFSVLENSQTYTLKVAESMPENTYEFKPQNAGWNFKELMNHIAYGIRWWEDNFIKSIKTEWQPPAVEGSKKEVIIGLRAAYESLRNTMEKERLNDKAVAGFHATLDHITHHRGQAVAYLRCKGIEPPEYLY